MTREGARALGLADRGVLRAGLRADIAIHAIEEPAELAWRVGGSPALGDVPRGCPARGAAMTELMRVERGDSALVIDVPHAGTFVPADIAARLAPAARALPDTDWHVDRLYAFARAAGATLVVATHARYVVDLNRDPTGAALYPGADNSEILPTTTFDREPIYARRDARRRGDRRPRRALPRAVPRAARRRGRARARAPRPRDPARRALDPLAGAALLRRAAAGPQPRHGGGGERRAGARAARGRRARRRGGHDLGRERPLQGRLDHAPLRAAGRRRARAAARGRAVGLHGRVAALALGRGARRRRSRGSSRGWSTRCSAWKPAGAA